jgi:chromosome segregation ATPase
MSGASQDGGSAGNNDMSSVLNMILKKMNTIEQNIVITKKELKSEVASIKSEVTSLKSEVASINDNIYGIKRKINQLEFIVENNKRYDKIVSVTDKQEVSGPVPCLGGIAGGVDKTGLFGKFW